MSAARFFRDTLNSLPKRIGDIPEDPEKYNLYAGLAALARQLDQLESQQKQIQQDIRHVLARLH